LTATIPTPRRSESPQADSGTPPPLALFALLLVGPLSVEMTLPAFPAISQSLGSAANAAAQSFSLFFVGYMIGQVLAGFAADLAGRRTALLAALAIFVAGGLLCAVAQTTGQFFFFRLIQAIGVGGVPLLFRVVLRDASSDGGAARSMSAHVGILCIVSLFTPALGAVLAGTAGWQSVFALQAAAGLGMAAWVVKFTCLRENLHPVPWPQYWRTVLAAGSHRHILPMSFTYAGLMVLTSNAPAVIMSRFSISPTGFSILLAIIGLIGTAGLFANRRLILRMPITRIVRGGAILSVAGCMAIVMMGPDSLPAYVLGALIFTFASGFVVPNGAILVLGNVPVFAGGRAAVAGAAEYSIVAAVVAFSTLLGAEPQYLLTLLAILSLATLASEALLNRQSSSEGNRVTRRVP
jgi:MFS transporter, DHA1 family, multidrug resistance protein